MAKTTRRDVIIALVVAIIIGIATGIIQGFELMDSWSKDAKFILASISVIVGGVIVRKFRGTNHKHENRYLLIGNVLLGVGLFFLLGPLWKQVFSNH